jgi:hypothetical protein
MIMILPLHILIAVASIIFTAYVYLSPSKRKLSASYALVALTIATGTVLVFQNQAYMLQACMSGLFFLGFEFFAIAMTQRKLASQSVRIDTSHRD